jgi:TetR/AcrR family transcriptional repressor of nem operon
MARPSVRNKIVEAALKVFVEKGFNACSVQDITDAAGVPKGSFYNHFASKEALGAEIVVLYGKGNTRREILADQSIPALDRLQRHFTALNRFFSGEGCEYGCLIGNFSAELSDQSPLIREELLKVFKRWTAEIEFAIRDGQAEGSISKKLKAGEIASFLINAYEGTILRARVDKTPRAFKAFMKVTFSSILA